MPLTTQDRKVAELLDVISQDDMAGTIVHLWSKWDDQREEAKQKWLELRNYLFATDTTTTSNQTLPWKNSTTLPKLTQIRDNLHSNYVSALFPNDDWLKWLADSPERDQKEKAEIIQAYIKNKAREGDFMTITSNLIYDYIDTGMAFGTANYINESKEMQDGEIIPGFIGPKAYRISPYDIVFNPTASSFKESPKIIRSVKSVGEVKKLAKTNPDYADIEKALEERQYIAESLGGYHPNDFEKAQAYTVDGYGNLHEYYASGYIEFLEFYGDYYDHESGELLENHVITVMDRRTVVYQKPMPTWLPHAPIYAVGWRYRPDNLWAMGPLENLVGMQYRIDHLENLKADAMDLCVHPPLKIVGEVEQFAWGPGAEIHIDENGDVIEMGKNLNGVIAATNEIAQLEAKMELYAGAPREAMGVRSPGEKTAYEVQSLENAAGRIFQEKITAFEVQLMEPLLNAMLEVAKRNFDGMDVIRTVDDDLAVEDFMTITKADITSSGVLRPVGARHFAAQAQRIQNINNMLNSALGQQIAIHMSSVELSRAVEQLLNLEKFSMFKPYVALEEQAESSRRQQQLQQSLQEEQATAEEEDIL